jgi:hypothetical protein
MRELEFTPGENRFLRFTDISDDRNQSRKETSGHWIAPSLDAPKGRIESLLQLIDSSSLNRCNPR